MSLLYVFGLATFVSYVGSIPPGSINLSVMQYAILGRKWAAVSFAFAAAFVEFFYAIIAVKFQLFLTANSEIGLIFKVSAGTILIALGIYNLTKTQKRQDIQPVKEKRNAFLKGFLISVANPLAIPFWLAVTLYLSSMNWLVLTDANYLFYVLGVSVGTFLLLLTVIQLGSKFESIRENDFLLYKMPGYIFIAMGVWTFVN